MPDPFAEAGAEYLEQVLRAAMRVPAAAGNPASGRIVARLMVALVSTGEDARLDPYLSFEPGKPSVCQVRCFDSPGRRPTTSIDLHAAEALRAAARLAAGSECTAEVFASDGAGRERCVFVTRGPMATYLFPDVGASLEVVPHPDRFYPAETMGANDQLWVLIEQVKALPSTADVIGALRELLGGMTVQVDATAIEDVIFEAVEHLSGARAGAPGGDGTPGTRLNASPTLSVGTPQPEVIEELAEAIVARLVREQRMPQVDELVRALVPLIPTFSQVAELVVARIASDEEHVTTNRSRGPALQAVPTNGSAARGANGAGASSLLYPEAEAAMTRLEIWMASI